MGKGRHIRNHRRGIDFHKKKLSLPPQVQASMDKKLSEFYKSGHVKIFSKEDIEKFYGEHKNYH